MAAESPEQVPRPGWDVLAVVALGGMVGATARRELAELVPTHAGRFPWSTFWTNISGSFLLGVVVVMALRHLRRNRYALPFVATGILGAYTTMATYIVQSTLLMKDGHVGTAVTYLLGSVIAGVACAYAGIRLGRSIAAGRR